MADRENPPEVWLVVRGGSLYGSDGPVGDLDERDAELVAEDMNEDRRRDFEPVARAVRYVLPDELAALRAAIELLYPAPAEQQDDLVRLGVLVSVEPTQQERDEWDATEWYVFAWSERAKEASK